MKLSKLVCATAIAVLTLSVMTGCTAEKKETVATPTPVQTATPEPTAEPTVTPTEVPSTTTLADGTYTKKSDAPENGYTYEMKMTIEGGKITALTYDGYNEDGKSKTQLVLDGEYVMTEDGPTWSEQAEALIAHVLENQSVDKITMNDEGKTDAIAGVSISVNGFVDFAKALLQEAASAPSTVSLKDGSYSKKGTEAENGYIYEMKMTVEGGKITALTYDGYNEDGKAKTQLVLDGEYVMTEDGPTWTEQAEALIAHVLENQSVDKITMNEEGKTDAIAGVSISVNGFVDYAKALLQEAAQ